MSAKDISRYLFQPQKRYSGVRMQQGRVILDSDWNESELIDDEELRCTRLEILCSKGTSNAGFLVGDVIGATKSVPTEPGANVLPSKETYDFTLESGSFYLGGLRFEVTPGIEERFLVQTDWLQMDSTLDALPERPTVAELTNADGSFSERHDLVYLRGWEQCVTAVEDSELRERALGGPDTSVRIRRMRRVEVLASVPTCCEEAFAALKTELVGDDTAHVFDDTDCGLRSGARLTVTFGAEGITEDPCKPQVTAGFLGAENQAIRVQLTAADRFIWGYDNASPFYRVQVESDGVENVKIKFLNLPPDQASQPLKGQAVEILSWSAILPNQEKISRMQGHLATVSTSYDPEDGTLTIATPIPQEWLDWMDGRPEYQSERDPVGRKKYFYLRLWTGGSGDAAAPDHEFTPGNAKTLQGSGLQVTFSEHGLRGDYWIIAARPNTPDIVVPWELMKAAPPAGPHFFFAPLALIRWTVGSLPDQSLEIIPALQDCRARFRPLCEVGGCTTVTVGDGRSTRGDFDSIEAAIAYLPDNGGQIQLLTGVHEANVRIVGRRNIVIKGCGKQTQVIPGDSNRAGSIFHIIDSQCITLEHMDLATLEGTAVTLEGSELGQLKEIEIRHNRILAYREAIRVVRGVDVNIHHNRIRMLDKHGAGVAITAWAEDSLIERNDIGVVPAEQEPPPDEPGNDTPNPADPCADPVLIYASLPIFLGFFNWLFGAFIHFLPVEPFKALGGIQIAAASERIKVLENKIRGGAGNGITLGGALKRPPDIVRSAVVTEHLIDHTSGQIWGDVRGPAGPLSGITLAFVRKDGAGSVLTATTDRTNGMFIFDAEPAQYSVSVTTPGFRLENIATQNNGEFGLSHNINVVNAEPGAGQPFAFIYEIEIDRNEIASMGLSGIGIPRIDQREPGLSTNATAVHNKQPQARLLALLGNPVINLGIHRNTIHNCLRNPFDTVLRNEARTRGLGGISLGFCESVTISHNRIERNGTRHIDPVCGIFISFGAKLDLHHNRLSDNGPTDPSVNFAPENGRRGGIIITATSFGIDDLILSPDRGFDTGRFAIRVHDNIVHQPMGQAIGVLAIGPVSVCSNRLNTDTAGPGSLERLAGAVLILNGGGRQGLPAGLTLFDSNQTRLGPASESATAQLIWSFDDLGYDANQCNALTGGVVIDNTTSFFLNTFLLAPTLRATSSRFKEPAGTGKRSFAISLLSRSTLLNNTNNNQGDHCIFAVNTLPGRPASDTGNQFLDGTLCRDLNKSIAPRAARFSVVSRI
jgi:hypothetical protein